MTPVKRPPISLDFRAISTKLRLVLIDLGDDDLLKDSIFRIENIFPYAVPPALTMLVCLYLASLSVKSARENRENRFFALAEPEFSYTVSLNCRPFNDVATAPNLAEFLA